MLALLSCALVFSAQAKVVTLYEHGKPVSDYADRIRTVVPGDDVVFPEKTFHIYQVYNNGNTQGPFHEGNNTAVFGVGDGKAIRAQLNIYRGKADPLFLRRYREGFDFIEFFGLDAPKFYPEESNEHYLVVEEIQNSRNLYKVLENFHKLPAQEQTALKSALLKLGLRAAEIGEIADFGLFQLGWDGKKLFIFDWNHISLHAHSGQPYETIYDYLNQINYISTFISPHFEKELRAKIVDHRKNTPSGKIQSDSQAFFTMPEEDLEHYVDMQILFGKWHQLGDFENLQHDKYQISTLERLKKSPRFPIWQEALKISARGQSNETFQFLKQHSRTPPDCTLLNSLQGGAP